ncbi:MAG TPA: hypothetical protein VI007_13455 [bacterium]
MRDNPQFLTVAAVAALLLVASWLVLLLMVIGRIPPSLLFSLGAYAASISGLAIGVFGVARHIRRRSL